MNILASELQVRAARDLWNLRDSSSLCRVCGCKGGKTCLSGQCVFCRACLPQTEEECRLRKTLGLYLDVIVFISEDRHPQNVHAEVGKALLGECEKFELD